MLTLYLGLSFQLSFITEGTQAQRGQWLSGDHNQEVGKQKLEPSLF